MKKLLFITTITCISFRLSSQHSVAQTKSDTVISTGSISIKNFINKAGKENPDITDWFFKTDNENYFIKLSEGKITPVTCGKFLDKPVKLKYIIKNGEWDSNGKEKEQSRIGKYIVVLELFVVNRKEH